MGRAGLRRQFQSKLQGHPARLQLARGRSAKPCARPQQPRGLCQQCPRGVRWPLCLGLVTLLRKQLVENPVKFSTAPASPTYATMVGAAAA